MPRSTEYDEYFSDDQKRTDLKSQSMRSASATIIAQIINYGVQTVGTIILARLLTPDDFGLVAMVVVFSLFLQNFGARGFTEAIIQRKELHHRQLSLVFWINAILSALLTLLFAAASPLISGFYGEPRLKSIAIVMAVTIGLTGLSTQHLALLMRNMHFRTTSVIAVIATVLSLGAAIALALLGFGYWAIVAKWVVAPLVTTLAAWVLCRWRPGLPSRGTGARPIVKFAVSTYGSFVADHFRRNIDKILIGQFYGSQPLGAYDRAYHLSMVIPILTLSPLSNVAIASFSKLTDEPERYRHNFLHVISLFAFSGMLFSAVLTITSMDLVLLLLGPKWSSSGMILAAFAPSIGVSIIYLTHAWLHLSLGTPDKWFRWGFIAFVVTALLYLGGVQFGAIGVAVAYSISFYILIWPALTYAGRPIQLTFSAILSVIWRSFVAAAVAGAISWFVLYSFGPTSSVFLNLHILVRLVAAMCVCTLVYLVLIVILHRSIRPITECLSALRSTWESMREKVKVKAG